jgi:hypothetical protein
MQMLRMSARIDRPMSWTSRLEFGRYSWYRPLLRLDRSDNTSHHASINSERGSGYSGRSLAAKEHHQVRHLFRLCETANERGRA